MYKCRTPVTGAQPTPRVASCGIIEPQEADSELKPASVYDKCITTEIDTNTIHPKDTQNNTYIIQHLDGQLRHLSSSRALDISRLISQYDVFGDHPKISNVLRHDVKVLPGTFPIKQSPYRVNPRKREQMQKEVQNRFTNQRLLRWSLQLQPYHIEMHHIKGLDNCLADTLSRLPTTPGITTRRDPEDPRNLLPGMQSCLVNRSMEAAEGRALPEEPSTGPQTTHVLVESTFTGQEPPHFSNDAESFLLRHPKKGGMSHT
ncbi:hypothetical protein O3P69_006459 [Scylla paramamosain]|uniref:Reverse transcriptase RNase H-like domain-containing protein n=1 Tax=Scylla paramamosain TaxID=85552 RepID=A0AAW0U4C3_SCYPA